MAPELATFSDLTRTAKTLADKIPKVDDIITCTDGRSYVVLQIIPSEAGMLRMGAVCSLVLRLNSKRAKAMYLGRLTIKGEFYAGTTV